MDAGFVSAGGLVAVDIVLLGPLVSVFFEFFFPPFFLLFLSSSLRAMICGQEKNHLLYRLLYGDIYRGAAMPWENNSLFLFKSVRYFPN